MKYLCLTLIALISYTSSAQDPRLFENTWYLHNLIIDGSSNLPPVNDEIEFVPLYFNEPTNMETSACYTMTSSVDFIGSDQFALLDGGMTLQGCEDPENNDFADFYMIGFWEDHFNDIFDYSLSESGTTKILTITNSSGNKAIYGNQILATEDFKEFQFYIYPNPASDHLSLSSKDIHGTIEVRIFNVEGKLLKKRNSNGKNDFQMDISSLSSGLYFLKIQTEEGNVVVKKFLKE